MHRKDVNDRMSSLAFKMEKVYNLDKKRGPAGEVYRYFMHTFKDLKESAWFLFDGLLKFKNLRILK